MKKVLLIDLHRKPYIPEDCVYTAGTIKAAVGRENIRIVRVFGPEDLDCVEQAISWVGEDELAALISFNDPCPSRIEIDLLDALVKRLKSRPKTALSLGGVHPTLAEPLFRESGDFNYLLVGWAWCMSRQWLEQNDTGRCIVLRSPAKPSFPEEARLEEDFDLVANPERCLGHLGDIPYVTFSFSRACKHACKFCVCSHYAAHFGGEVVKDDARADRELAFLIERFSVRHVSIIDMRNPLGNMKKIAAAGLGVVEQVDVCVKDLSEEYLDVLKEVGVECVFFGLESADPAVQTKIAKTFDMELLSSHLESADRRGIMFEGNFIAGLRSVMGGAVDADTLRGEISHVAAFWRRHRNLRVLLRPYMPFIGTPLGDALWKDAVRPGGQGWHGYLNLINDVLEGLPLDASRPLPPCYASPEVYDLVNESCADFVALAKHVTSLYLYPAKNPDKAAVCDLLTSFCFDALQAGRYGFSEFLTKTLSHLAKWK